ncbi:alpha/beta hydrolase [Rhodobacterales bacterium]|nr:alpha/beta hydrolase [Rhodobacterales bacterium]
MMLPSRRLAPRLFVALVVLFGLVSCGSRPELGVLALNEMPAPGAKSYDILVATTREKDEHPDTYFNGERAQQINYADLTISVPPTHQPGQIEWPTAQPGNPETTFVTRQAGYIPDRKAFIRDVNQRLAKLPKGKRRIFLFIHGYNTRFPEGLFRFTQMVHDGNIQSVPVLFTWASRGKLQDYLYDLNSAAIARSALEQTIGDLAQTNAEGITIMAHSMGNWLLMETAVRADPQRLAVISRKLDNVVLAAPDIDIDLFKSQLKQIGRPRKPYVVIVSRDDKALSLSQRLSGGIERVGAYSDDQELAELGAIVIDVTELSSLDSTNHSKFAQLAGLSPEFRKVLGQADLTSVAAMGGSPDQATDLADLIGDTVALPIRIITAPVTLAAGSLGPR